MRPSLTPVGRNAVGAAFVLAVLGWALGYQALTIAAAAIAGLLVISSLLSVSIQALDVERVVEPSRVARGTRAVGLVSVRNTSRRRSQPCVAVEAVGKDTVDITIPALRPGQSIAVPYDVATQRRGVLEIGPLALGRSDPLGLWRTRRYVGDVVSLVVHPAVYPIDLHSAGANRHVDGPTSHRATNGTLTFHSLREYTSGDDIRRVHWRSSARTGTLMVREHVDTAMPSAVVIVDVRRSCYRNDSFEDAVDVAASVVSAAECRGYPIRLVTSAGDVLMVRSGQRAQHLLDALAALQPSDNASLQRAAQQALRTREHDTVVVIAGELSHVDLGEVSAITKRFAQPTLVTISDATESVRWTAGTHIVAATSGDVARRWNNAR
jgi:uncharacterized protein (DUF58 family)